MVARLQARHKASFRLQDSVRPLVTASAANAASPPPDVAMGRRCPPHTSRKPTEAAIFLEFVDNLPINLEASHATLIAAP